jgi:hypothetical protein
MAIRNNNEINTGGLERSGLVNIGTTNPSAGSSRSEDTRVEDFGSLELDEQVALDRGRTEGVEEGDEDYDDEEDDVEEVDFDETEVVETTEVETEDIDLDEEDDLDEADLDEDDDEDLDEKVSYQDYNGNSEQNKPAV